MIIVWLFIMYHILMIRYNMKKGGLMCISISRQRLYNYGGGDDDSFYDEGFTNFVENIVEDSDSDGDLVSSHVTVCAPEVAQF